MKKFKEWISNNFLSIISLFSTGLGWVAMVIWKFISKTFTALDWVLITILLVQSIFFIGFACWRKFSFKSYHYPSGPIRPSYLVLEQKLNYLVDEKNEKLNFTSDKKIKCCDDRLPSIQGKYIWTGDSDANIPKNQLGYNFLSINNKKGIWTYYMVQFSDCLLKGQIKDIKYEYHFDKYTTSSPFLSATTEEPTKYISFHLELGNSVEGTTFTIEEFRSTEGEYPISSKTLPISANGTIDYEIKHPKRFRYYRISWEWKKT